jgi:putative ubiquitin-RnfH superfamily antitoxin RatB of RatAB toxin-antitoxin module
VSGLRIEVAYALPDRCWRIALQLPEGATVAMALQAADLAVAVPEAVVDAARLAVFGRLVTPQDVLHDGDRVEILRPLQIDPKQARRQRAARRTQ